MQMQSKPGLKCAIVHATYIGKYLSIISKRKRNVSY